MTGLGVVGGFVFSDGLPKYVSDILEVSLIKDCGYEQKKTTGKPIKYMDYMLFASVIKNMF